MQDNICEVLSGDQSWKGLEGVNIPVFSPSLCWQVGHRC